MKRIRLGVSDLESSRMVYGCMRIAGDGTPGDRARGRQALQAALAAGYTHFDHADLYGGGACEALFGELLREEPGLRDDLIITSKCGIRLPDDPEAGDPKRYDFSFEHIVRSVAGSLERLNTDRLDLLLLHRPDYLFNAAEVATAFESLAEQGMVRHFGVSNFTPTQVELLQAQCDAPLLVNQVEINIDRLDALEDGTLDQCQHRRISPMAWCPLGGVAYPAWGGTLTPEGEQRIAGELGNQAERYGVEPWLVMLAWLLKHPAGILPIVGSTTPERIAAAPRALALDYRREDWYRLLEARRGQAVP
jgi:predicted oxidoreductase